MQSILQYRRLHHRDLDTQSRQIAHERQHEGKDSSSTIEVTANGDDSTSPREWSTLHRTRAAAIVWLLVFSQGWVSTCDSEATKPAGLAYHVSETSQTLATALFMIGLSTGALIAGPVSETVGRNPVYLGSTVLLLVFTLGAALAPNFGAQVAFRFLSGVASSPTLSVYGGTLADLFSDEERKAIWPVFATAPLLGPVLAPFAGGWIVQNYEWRWTLWVGLIFAGFSFLLALLFLPETFGPELLRWKAQHLRQVTGNHNYMAPIESAEPLQKRLTTNAARPITFFTTEPIVMALGFYLVLVFLINFSFLNGFEFIFTQTYSLSTGLTSLDFLSIALGILLDVALTPLYNRLANRVHRKNCRAFVKRKHSNPPDSSSSDSLAPTTDNDNPQTAAPPELALLRAAIAAPFLPTSLFWLAWTNYANISPASGYIATLVFGYAFSALFISSYQYIISSYEVHSSSALASVTLARYFVGGGMIVATRPMYQGIGVHWVLSLLGVLAAVLVPVPWVLVRYGDSVRRRSKFASSPEDD
ncbi:hypothetical protein LTR62_008541 [Meristemomyces frigidus]|uniref:Major facilitator superfamily (MFS) profile domain-containing protein n=1 Tax=Meristemomyces frigidus TaxID=1508187 RepID=A0AAN7TMY5_9PEZI|nr:hypothetical protein LTR62_008541 [Meristemomyces frigidus]